MVILMPITLGRTLFNSMIKSQPSVFRFNRRRGSTDLTIFPGIFIFSQQFIIMPVHKVLRVTDMDAGDTISATRFNFRLEVAGPMQHDIVTVNLFRKKNDIAIVMIIGRDRSQSFIGDQVLSRNKTPSSIILGPGHAGRWRIFQSLPQDKRPVRHRAGTIRDVYCVVDLNRPRIFHAADIKSIELVRSSLCERLISDKLKIETIRAHRMAQSQFMFNINITGSRIDQMNLTVVQDGGWIPGLSGVPTAVRTGRKNWIERVFIKF